jgi:type 1 glutamine amidotransferase
MDCKLALSGVSTELRTDRDKLHSGREVRTYADNREKTSSSVINGFFSAGDLVLLEYIPKQWRIRVKMLRLLLICGVALCGRCGAQTAGQPMKHLLALGEEKGYRHEAVSHALATIERLGRTTGLWTTTIRTDTEVLTKKKLEYNAKNLNDFDAVLFYTGGELEMNDEQKAALLSFVHDDGKGFVGVHSATITFTSWREYGEMIGGYFDEHPWGTFDAPILVEDANFPGMQQWPKSFVLTDEIYQMKDFSRDKVRVLMRLDATKLDLHNPRVHRKDLDFAVTWAKMYGKGRVYYSTLGHVEQNWDDPRIQKMYVEAVKWAMGLVDADVTPRTAAANANDARSDRRTEEAPEFAATPWQKGTCRHFARYDGFSYSGTGGSGQRCGD